MRNYRSSDISSDSKSESDQTPGAKRRRAPNFTDKEIRILMKLVFDHIEIIENKKTDAETWRLKDRLWNSVTENFNSYPGVCKRTVEMIRQKYDTVKKMTRKKEAKNREEEDKVEPDIVEMEDYEVELMRLLELFGGQQETTIPSETKYPSTSVKTETNGITSPVNLEELVKDERFIITEEDMLEDLSFVTVNHPQLQLGKNQMKQIEREEERRIAEHEYRMRTEEIKRKLMLNRDKRDKREHQKRMQLLEIELDLKRRKLEKIDK